MKTPERDYDAGEPILVIPRVGSAYNPKGYSSHPPNPLRNLLFFVETTVIVAPFWLSRGQRQQSVPPVHRCLPCRLTNSCGYNQGEPSPYLISRVLLEELDFRTTGYLTATSKNQAHDGIRLSCLFQYNPYAG